MSLARRARQDERVRPRSLVGSALVAGSVALAVGATSAVLTGGLRGTSTVPPARPAPVALAGAAATANGPDAAAARTDAKPSARPAAAPTATAGPAKAAAARKHAKPRVVVKQQAKVPKPGAKKGVGSAWGPSTLTALNDVGASWYYTWRTSSGLRPAKARFVPMIWGAKQVTASDLATARKSSTGELLGFNEPDRPDQANLTPQQACDLWPRLQATGLRLGAPAVSWGADMAGGWLDRFMTCARKRHLRVDFIPLHFYSSNYTSAANDLKRYIAATHARYRKPVWITEYALLDFGAGRPQATPAQQSAFVRRSTAMMNRLSYLERYAWFALEYDKARLGTGLYDAKGRPTPWGSAYRAAR
jgi:Glycosyl hydrolase catalytic core